MGILNIVLHVAGAVLGACTATKHGKALWDAGKEAINKRKNPDVEETQETETEE